MGRPEYPPEARAAAAAGEGRPEGGSSSAGVEESSPSAAFNSTPPPAPPAQGSQPQPQSRDVSHSYSTGNLVFILISDVGWEEMVHGIVHYQDREHLPLIEFRNHIKRLLDRSWSRLQFGKVVNGVVPFMPLEPAHILQVRRVCAVCYVQCVCVVD